MQIRGGSGKQQIIIIMAIISPGPRLAGSSNPKPPSGGISLTGMAPPLVRRTGALWRRHTERPTGGGVHSIAMETGGRDEADLSQEPEEG